MILESYLRWRIRHAPIVREPFPHVVMRRFLPPWTYRALARALPAPGVLQAQDKRGRKFNLPINPEKPEFALLSAPAQRTWLGTRERLARVLTTELAAKFRPEIRQKYVELWGESAAEQLLAEGLRANSGRVMRRLTGYDLGPHCDSANFVVTCLLYFTSAPSGGLQLYRPERVPAPRMTGTRYPQKDEGIACEPVTTLPLRENCFVTFPNTPRAIHGVHLDKKFSKRVLRTTYQFHLVPQTSVVSGWPTVGAS